MEAESPISHVDTHTRHFNIGGDYRVEEENQRWQDNGGQI